MGSLVTNQNCFL